MKTAIKTISLLCLGGGLCLIIQFGLRAYEFYRTTPLGYPPNNYMMLESGLREWSKVKDALRVNDAKAVNDLLRVKPGEIELDIRMCPFYPANVTPIAEIILKNVSSRPLTVFEPKVTGVKCDIDVGKEGRWRDEFTIDWELAFGPHWCRVLLPQESLILAPAPLNVHKSGKHHANFRVNIPVYSSISKSNCQSHSYSVASTACEFEVWGTKAPE